MFKLIRSGVLFLILLLAFGCVLFGLSSPSDKFDAVHAAPMPTPDKPPYTGYKGVTIGLKTDEARTKLGTPKDKSDAQDYFEISGSESVQVFYDAAKNVTAVTVTYRGKLESAPTAMSIFGEDATANADGGIFKMVRYPKAGFWISYNKIPGSDGLIMVALQKL